MNCRQQGFTVIELIISLVIVSIIMVGLLTAMRSFGITEEKLAVRLAKADERRVVSGFLEDVLCMAVMRRRSAQVGTPDESTFFGTQAAIQWIGVMPARHGAGGLYHFKLQVSEQLDGGSKLVLSYLPYMGLDVLPDWALAEQRILIGSVDGFQLSYQLDDGGDWRSEWRNTSEPGVLARVRLLIKVAGDEWPLLVIPVRYPLPSGAAGGIVMGPR